MWIGPGKEAARLDDRWVGSGHVLLAILATRSAAAEVLQALGVTREAVSERLARQRAASPEREEPRRRELSPNPDMYQVMGRADAFAAADGQSRAQPEHWLLAIVWSDTTSAVGLLDSLDVTQRAVLDGLRERGARVPEIEPPLYRRWRGHHEVEVSSEELRPLIKLLQREHRPGSEWRWGFNWTNDELRRARVMAEEGIDLDDALRRSREPGV